MIKKENTAVKKGDDNKNHSLGSLLNCLSLLINTALVCYLNVGLYDAYVNTLSNSR
jgi:hypothetical protein